MLVCTAMTLILPDSINYRKTTLHEYALAEHAKLEQSSIELVEMKVMEETKEEEKIETGLKKFGAMLGDGVEVGCNSVLNPGTVIGRNSNIYPISSVRGFIPSDSIYKEKGNIVKKQ